MKLALALFAFALPFGAQAAPSAGCRLILSAYETTDYVDYVHRYDQVLQQDAVQLAAEKVTFNGAHSPVFFRAELSPNGKIEGSLWIKVDQPGPSIADSREDGLLSISVIDDYSNFRDVYRLDCEVR